MKESARAKQAWADYLALPNRSLESLLERYKNAHGAPTRRFKTLADWSRFFGWQARLAAIADAEAKATIERDAAYRREILESGLAIPHERVRVLKKLAEVLLEELHDDARRWVRDVKQVGGAAVDIERFNAAEVEQFRGLLDDIAKEKSERKEIREISGLNGAPIAIREIVIERAESRGSIEPE